MNRVGSASRASHDSQATSPARADAHDASVAVLP